MRVPGKEPRASLRRLGVCGCSSVVERYVANVKVVGANPISRSIRRRSTTVVQQFRKLQVVGSIPIDGSNAFARIAQPAERLFCKQDVAGATPAAGSTIFLGSTMVVRSAVNRMVARSSRARGAVDVALVSLASLWLC